MKQPAGRPVGRLLFVLAAGLRWRNPRAIGFRLSLILNDSPIPNDMIGLG